MRPDRHSQATPQAPSREIRYGVPDEAQRTEIIRQFMERTLKATRRPPAADPHERRVLVMRQPSNVVRSPDVWQRRENCGLSVQ